MSEVTLWGRRNSGNVQKVLWALDELGVRYRQIDAGGSFGGLDTPEFLARNPNGRVPVIEDGALAVWESNTILRYLAAQYGDESLWVAEAGARSHADRWVDWTVATLQPAFGKLFQAAFRTPQAQRNATVIAAAQKDTERLFRILDAHLETRPFLAGERFTYADIPAGVLLHRYFNLDLPIEQPRNVLAWKARLEQRPGYAAHVAVSFDDQRPR